MNGFISTSYYSSRFRLSILAVVRGIIGMSFGEFECVFVCLCVCGLDSWELFCCADQSKIVLKLPTTHTHRETRFKIYALN